MSDEIGYEIDFLPVGTGEKSGDAIALRWGDLHSADPTKQTVVVIDGGFTDSGDALVEHIKKYYRTDMVDCVISTHPDGDHVSGLNVVLEKLTVLQLAMHRPWSKEHTRGISDLFHDGRVTDNSVKEKLKAGLESAYQLEQLAIRKKIEIIEPFTGSSGWKNTLRIIGPTKDYYDSLLPDFRSTPEPKRASFSSIIEAAKDAVKRIAEAWGVETLDDTGETSAENNSSAITLFHFNDNYLLFTGDAGIPALENAITFLERERFDFTKLKFIQVPHHGSKRNIGPTILNKIVGQKLSSQQKTGKTAFVSAAKDSDKHPAKKVTNAFLRRGASVYATQGEKIYHYYNTPSRGWKTAPTIPFYTEVEE